MECSSLRAANSALREGRFEDALALYAVARQEVPELSGTIDFNVDWMGLTLQKGEKNSVVAASALEPPVEKLCPRERCWSSCERESLLEQEKRLGCSRVVRYTT